MEAANPVLVERYRGNTLESFHRGGVCILNKDFEVLFSLGDIEQVTYPRSSLKLFQHLPLIESGALERFGVTLEEIAVMCGSHNAEDEHIRVVSSILEKAGVTEDLFRCGPQDPNLRRDRIKLYKEGSSPRDIHNNCSGKHAGFLALAKFLKLDLENYLSPDHQVQKEIKEAVSQMHEVPQEEMQAGIDGCSAPIYAMPLRSMAVGAVNLMFPEKFGPKRAEACKRVIEAVTAYPNMVAGSKRYCTEMIKAYYGKVFGKTGAEGVFVLGIPEKQIGVAIKIDDGRSGAQYRVAQEILRRLLPDFKGAENLEKFISEPVLNWRKVETGVEKVNAGLFEGLGKV